MLLQHVRAHVQELHTLQDKHTGCPGKPRHEPRLMRCARRVQQKTLCKRGEPGARAHALRACEMNSLGTRLPSHSTKMRPLSSR